MRRKRDKRDYIKSLLSLLKKAESNYQPLCFLSYLFANIYAECLFAIIFGIDACAIFKRNRRTKDVVAFVVRLFHLQHPLIQADFSRTNPEKVLKNWCGLWYNKCAKLCANIYSTLIIGSLIRSYFSRKEYHLRRKLK